MKFLNLAILTAQTEAVVPVDEDEIVSLGYNKVRLTEKLQTQAEPKGSFEEKLEPALTFLSSLWKIWKTQGSMQVHLRRLVLKLAFRTRIRCYRNQEARALEISFSSKAL